MKPLEIAERWEAWAKVANAGKEGGLPASVALQKRHLYPDSALAAAGALRELQARHSNVYGPEPCEQYDIPNAPSLCAAIAALCALESGGKE